MADIYVRELASGSNNGSDWNNAYKTITGAEFAVTRGDTIYVADGSYEGPTFNKTNNGIITITVKKATTESHGTTTGWDNSFGDGQAILTPITFGSSNWILDGQVGTMSYNTGDYGFCIPSVGGTQDSIYIAGGVGVSYSGITIKNVASIADSGDYGKVFIRGHSQIQTMDNVTISGCLCQYFGQAISVVAMAGRCSGLLFTKNICLSGTSSASFHGEQINANSSAISGSTISFNIFDSCVGTAIICANNSDIVDTKIYGNIFVDSDGGNGIIAGTSNACCRDVVVYNNTFIRGGNGPWFGAGVGNETGNSAKNNLFFGMDGGHTANADYGYNSYFLCTNIPTGDSYTQSGLENPFINSGSNYHLAIQTNQGFVFPSPYDVDFDGITRGVDGVWSRGAFEYLSRTFKRLGRHIKFKSLSPL